MPSKQLAPGLAIRTKTSQILRGQTAHEESAMDGAECCWAHGWLEIQMRDQLVIQMSGLGESAG